MVYSANAHYGYESNAKGCGWIAGILIVASVGVAFYGSKNDTILVVSAAVMCWILHRFLRKRARNNERYLVTQSHFLMVSGEKRQAHGLERLRTISINGPDTDDESRYRIEFEDEPPYTMYCGTGAKEFAKALSEAAQVPITERDDSIKIVLPRRKE